MTVNGLFSGRIKFISTHTLTWSVTKLVERLTKLTKISTHTLTWSVTLSATKPMKTVNNFNSHAHVERDLSDFLRRDICSISTHTLTWSVTYGEWSEWYQNYISTHTLTWSVT